MPSAPDPQDGGETRALIAAKQDARRDAQARRTLAFAAWAARGTAPASLRLAQHAPALLQATGIAINPPSHAVSAYLPMRTEFDPLALLGALAAVGLRTALPVVVARAKPLLFRQWAPGGETVPAGFGTREPPPANPTIEPDLLLVPLLAFDGRGFRLGYGGGYYDRTLHALRSGRSLPGATSPIHAIGIAFDEQEIDAVPHLDYDERLDGILTPSGLRSFPR